MTERVQDNIDIEASAEAIFEVATDFESYPEWNANIKRVEVKDTDGEGRATKVFFEVDARVRVVGSSRGRSEGAERGLFLR